MAGSTSGKSFSPKSLTKTEVLQLRSELHAREVAGVGTVIDLPGDVLFDFDKYDIRRDAEETLRKVATLIYNSGDAPIAVNGHTDSKGGDDYNQTLSENRAKAVKDFLTRKLSVPGTRLTAEGFGESQPIAPNTTDSGQDNPSGRQLNRRVEIIIHNMVARAR